MDPRRVLLGGYVKTSDQRNQHPKRWSSSARYTTRIVALRGILTECFGVDSGELPTDLKTRGRPTAADRAGQKKAEGHRKGGAPRGMPVFELPKVVTRLRTEMAVQAAQRILSLIVRMAMGWWGG